VSEEALEALHREIDACLVCRERGLSIEKPTRLIRGNAIASVLAIGIAPSAASQRLGLAFAGASFRRLSEWFKQAGFDSTEAQLRSALYLTSLAKCAASPDTATLRRQLWNNCGTFLWRQIALVQPRLILLLGAEPTHAILGKSAQAFRDVIGQGFSTEEVFASELFKPVGRDCRWLVMPHPSGLSRLPNDRDRMAKVIAALRHELAAIGFRVPDIGEG
jgi:uracil-DNA glycosylase family 4